MTSTVEGPYWAVGGSDLDIADPDFCRAPHRFDIWAQARTTHPVAWTKSAHGGEFWSVVTYDLGDQVLKQAKLFSSAKGMRLGGNPAAVAFAANEMMVVSDGDAHRRLRAVHAPWFTGKALGQMHEALVRRLTRRVTDLIERAAPFDLMTELASRVPTWALCQMMGVPDAQWDDLAELTDVAFDDSDPGPRATRGRAAAHAMIFDQFAKLVALRRKEPGDDIVSALIHTEVDGRGLTENEVLLNCDGLMNGGLETTPHAAAGAILEFARRPELWNRLRHEPDLFDRAVEEILRWTSPPMHAMRVAEQDIRLGDALIREGDRVVVWLPSGNRDERVYDRADELVIDRTRNRHLSFGTGPHYCVGAMLARLELRCLLEVMAGLVESFAVTGEVVRKRSNFLNGIESAEIAIAAAVRGGKGT
jgi:cytochrome P450